MRSMYARVLQALLIGTLGAGCVEGPPTPLQGNLLLGSPSGIVGVTKPERITDGLASEEGDTWLSGLSAQFKGSGAYVEWDLGHEQPVRCGLVQGDNNDEYLLSGSADGEAWKILWTAGAAPGAGMRLRQGVFEGHARYLRWSARGGDGLFSVAEAAVFSACPTGWPQISLARSQAVGLEDAARWDLVWFAIAAVGFLLIQRRAGPRWQYALGLVPLALGYLAFQDLADIYPIVSQEPLLRAMVAVIAAAVIAKQAFLPERFAATATVQTIALVLLAVVSVGSYYHFGALQFGDQAHGRRTFVHTFDMRHYFPQAKYPRELRFDGLYLASLAAYQDEFPNMKPEELANVRLRDLKNYEMRRGDQVGPELAEIKSRFSPTRWTEFRRDMRYFMDTMGPAYLGSMRDHGGNATPVWLVPAWLIFRNTHATEASLSWAGFIDPALLLILFIVVGRTFGLRLMLYTAILFGATDFYNFDSNLMGSTLRQDWLVALGLGACALKRGRYVWGGFFLAHAGLIRAFPALAAAFLAVPALWWGIDHVRAAKTLPTVAQIRQRHMDTVRAVAGVVLGVVGLMALSTLIFGWSHSWQPWLQKIAIHANGPSANNVGLRNVMAFNPNLSAAALEGVRSPHGSDSWSEHQLSTLASRRVPFYLLVALGTLAALVAARGRTLYQAAMLGLLTVPILFYPSNYYCHFIFLLPLGLQSDQDNPAGDRTLAYGMLVLLAICVGQYFSLEERWEDLRYTYQSFMLLTGVALILVPFVRTNVRDLRRA